MSLLPSKAAIALATVLSAGAAFAAEQTTKEPASPEPSAQQICEDLAKSPKNLTVFPHARTKTALGQHEKTGCQYSYGLNDEPLVTKTFNLTNMKETAAFTRLAAGLKRENERGEKRATLQEQRRGTTHLLNTQ